VSAVLTSLILTVVGLAMTASLKSKWAKKESGETAALFRAASAAPGGRCQDRAVPAGPFAGLTFR
jgi:hypothetical protein